MNVDWNGELVDQLESHWDHQLRPRLDGLTDAEYFWQPVAGCLTLDSRGQVTRDDSVVPAGRPPFTTIAWRLGHLIDVFGPPGVPHFEALPTDRPATAYAASAAGALRQLDDGHDAWIRDVRGLGTAGIARPQGALSPPQFADAPIARLVMYVHLEVIHHGAEVCLLRDLYLGSDVG